MSFFRNQLFTHVSQHFKCFFDDLDLIKDTLPGEQGPKGSSSSVGPLPGKAHYVLALVMYFSFGFHSLYVLIRENALFDGEAISASSRLFTHRIFPKQFYFQGDIVALLSIGLSAVLHSTILAEQLLHPQVCLYTVQDRQGHVGLVNAQGVPLNRGHSKRLLAFRKQARTLARLAMFFVEGFLVVYFGQQVWRKALYDAANLLFFFLALPLMLIYAVLADVQLPAFFAITCRYVQIEQWFLLDRLEHLVLSVTVGRRGDTLFVFATNWNLYLLANSRLARLSDNITRLNGFWCKPVSFFALGYIAIVNYLAYSFFFIESTPLLKAFFGLFTVQDTVLLFLIISQAVVVYQRNRHLQASLDRASMYFQFRAKSNLRTLLKSHDFLVNRQCAKSGFRFLNGWIIDSSTFEKTIYGITVFFLLIFNKQHY